MHRGTWAVLAVMMAIALSFALATRAHRSAVARPGYCEQLLSFCIADRFAQPGAGYKVKAYCGVTAALWKECAVVLWNGRSFSYGVHGSVKVACFLEEARLYPKTHVVVVRRLHLALTPACDVVQMNA